jgi:hypothetical protein
MKKRSKFVNFKKKRLSSDKYPIMTMKREQTKWGINLAKKLVRILLIIPFLIMGL